VKLWRVDRGWRRREHFIGLGCLEVVLSSAIIFDRQLVASCIRRLPKVQARDDIVAHLVFICVKNLLQVSSGHVVWTMGSTYLSGGSMEPPDILGSENVDETAALHMAYFYKARLES
jgi:hypothetical protein